MTAKYLLASLFYSLPPLMAQNLSIPLAFACLLHLANEKVGKSGKRGRVLCVNLLELFIIHGRPHRTS